MATVGVLLPVTPVPKQRKMILSSGPLSSRRPYIAVDWAPQGATKTGLATAYTEIARPGLPSLVVRSNDPLAKLSFEFVMGSKDNQKTGVNDKHNKLFSIVNGRDPVYISYGPGNGVAWRVTDLTATTEARQAGTNVATRIRYAITLTLAIDAPTYAKVVTPVKGPAPKKDDDDDDKPKTKVIKYTVKRGDTLRAIAKKYLGKESRYKEIAKDNKIRNPNLIYPGQKLRIEK